MTPAALWFFIGALVAIAVLITDFLVDRDNKQVLYNRFSKELEAASYTEFCKHYYPLECLMHVLLGPVAIYMYWSRTKALRKYRLKLSI